uniref:Uncharacterized protein n=1 Tax=Oryza brachyantha TaxID=4533 RepID=J3L953_ORYBR
MAMFLCSGVYKRRIQQDELMALNCVPKKQRKQLYNAVADLQVQCRRAPPVRGTSYATVKPRALAPHRTPGIRTQYGLLPRKERSRQPRDQSSPIASPHLFRRLDSIPPSPAADQAAGFRAAAVLYYHQAEEVLVP